MPKPWTDSELRTLEYLKNTGKTFKEIGAIMGKPPSSCQRNHTNRQFKKFRYAGQVDRHQEWMNYGTETGG